MTVRNDPAADLFTKHDAPRPSGDKGRDALLYARWGKKLDGQVDGWRDWHCTEILRGKDCPN